MDAETGRGSTLSTTASEPGSAELVLCAGVGNIALISPWQLLLMSSWWRRDESRETVRPFRLRRPHAPNQLRSHAVGCNYNRTTIDVHRDARTQLWEKWLSARSNKSSINDRINESYETAGCLFRPALIRQTGIAFFLSSNFVQPVCVSTIEPHRRYQRHHR